jgi:hypothetical protein
MVEAPDPKADFPVNLPRTEAPRNCGKLGMPTPIGREGCESLGKSAMNHASSVGKDIRMRETAASPERGDLLALFAEK